MNGSIMKIAGEEALRQNIIKTKEYVQQHGGGGHTIITASSLPMAGQPNLQFEGVHVENIGQTGQGKTVIKPQFHVCATEAEWNQMSDTEKNDPLIYWVRPWANSDAFATDRTPVGTVVSVGAAKTGEATGVSTPTGRFPTDDYLVCDGSTYITVDGKTVYICQQNFPKLYDYFVEAYGTATYFGSGRGQQGDFSLPDWSSDFPENEILCIKAQISSTAITFAEVDDENVTEDNVWSAKKVSDYLYNMRRRVRKNITSEIQEDNGARLIAAIAEQDLAKYGFATGDYFTSPADRTLTTESYSSSTLAQTDTTVRLTYHLADPNTYYGGYNSYSVLDTPHEAIVVDSKVMRQWHSGDASSVGYNGSKLQAFLEGTGTSAKNRQLMAAIKADMIALFGGSTGLEHLLSHQKLFTTALANWGWQANKYISALTESEVYGHTEWSVNTYQEGEAVKPLEIFQKFRWNEIFGNTYPWLRNMSAASSACDAYSYGRASNGGVTGAFRAAGLILLH